MGALLLKIAEHEIEADCHGCFGFKTPAAITFEELAPETARHQWMLGVDGNQLTCVRKCGQVDWYKHAEVGSVIDEEQESVTQWLPYAVDALMRNNWFINGQTLAPAQATMPMLAASGALPEKQIDLSASQASTLLQASMLSQSASLFSYNGNAAMQQGMFEAPRTSVADEIRKLAELMREGLLTEQEFQAQKKWLLSEPIMQ